jgi:hypothetical protein
VIGHSLLIIGKYDMLAMIVSRVVNNRRVLDWMLGFIALIHPTRNYN